MEVECDDMLSRRSSIMKLGTFRKGKLSDERGDVAVLTAIFVMVLLTLLPLVAYTAAVGQQPTVSFDQKYQGALGAAEAGVAAFVSDLNAGTAASTACINVSGYGWCATSGSSWVPLSTSSASYYEYEAYSNSSSGPFTIISTGKRTGSYRTVYRTVEETVSQQAAGGSFADYFLYADSNKTPSPSSAENTFSHSRDILAGPMMTNGKYYSDGKRSKCPAATLYSSNTASGLTCSPSFALPMYLPTSLSQTQIPSEAQTNGCTYYGPTYIVFQASGGYTVDSPGTTTTSATGCYPGPYSSVAADSNGVIYVSQCASGVSNCNSLPTEPNSVSFQNGTGNYVYDYTATSTGVAPGSAVVEGNVNGKFTVAASNNIYISGPLCYESFCPSAGYSSSDQVLGLVATDSVLLADARANNPLVTGNMDQNSNTSPATVPSIGTEYFAYDPASTSYSQVDAAVMALNGTFAAHEKNKGADSFPLNFYGSVAVEFPCVTSWAAALEPVSGGTGMCNANSGEGGLAYLEASTGHHPKFTYDNNLQTGLPPFFPTSVSSTVAVTFTASDFTEIANSYQPLGLS